MLVKRSFGTHDGSFHADEVSACALLLFTDRIDWDKIVRTRNEEELRRCEYVCDVGRLYDPQEKRFDHHQSDYRGSLSSAGMVLRYLREEASLDENLYNYFRTSFVKGVDAIDNGEMLAPKGYCTFSALIGSFVPIYYDSPASDFDEGFMRAVRFVYEYLLRLQERYGWIQRCRDTVKGEMEKRGRFLMFDRPIPWMESFFALGGERHPAQFVIMPMGKSWKLRGIPPSFDRKMEVRLPFPRSWSGLSDEALEEKAGIPGAIFCHKGRFISVWKTKESAQSAAESILCANYHPSKGVWRSDAHDF